MQRVSCLSWMRFDDCLTTGIQSSLWSSPLMEELFLTNFGRTCVGTGTCQENTAPQPYQLLLASLWLCLLWLGPIPPLCELVPHERDIRRFNWSFFADSPRTCLLHFSNRLLRFFCHDPGQLSLLNCHIQRQISSAMFIAHCKPSKNLCYRRWYSSGPKAIPNGILV